MTGISSIKNFISKGIEKLTGSESSNRAQNAQQEPKKYVLSPAINDSEYQEVDTSGLKVSLEKEIKYEDKKEVVDEKGKKTGCTKTYKKFIDGSSQVEYKDKNTGVTTTILKGADGGYKQFTSGKFDVLEHSKDYDYGTEANKAKVYMKVDSILNSHNNYKIEVENYADAIKDQIAANSNRTLDVVRVISSKCAENYNVVLFKAYNAITESSLLKDLSKTCDDKDALVDIAKHMFANLFKNPYQVQNFNKKGAEDVFLQKIGNFAQYVNAGPANGESVETYLKNIDEFMMSFDT